jgi:ABC-2 type transport system permease protein
MGVDMKKGLLRAIKHFWLFVVANLRNAMGLRAAFWMDVIGMMINNLAFVIIWIFFFAKMGRVNGWGSAEIIGLEGMVAIAYGVTYALAGGVSMLPKAVNSGNFDNYLLSPVNLYVRILSSFSQTSAFGDLLYGVLLSVIFFIAAKLPLTSILLFVFTMPFCSLIMLNFVFVTGLISFLIPDTAEVASNLFELMITPALYPSGLLSKTMRFIFFFIVPAILVGGASVELVLNPSLSLVLTIVGMALFWTWLAIFLLNKARKHYESGNLTGYKG